MPIQSDEAIDGCEDPFACFSSPILLSDPVPGFVAMTTDRPDMKFLVGQVLHLGESPCGGFRRVIVDPLRNRIQTGFWHEFDDARSPPVTCSTTWRRDQDTVEA